MQYIRGLEHYDNARKTAVTFGKFDGLHKEGIRCLTQKNCRTKNEQYRMFV